MNKKMIYIVVAVIVVVLIVGVAGVMLLSNNGNNGNTNPTPTPPPATPVSQASTLQFSVNETVTATNDVVAYQYSCKNFNTSTEVVRVDMNLGAAGNFSYIVDSSAQKSWVSMDNGATWTASVFADDNTNYDAPFHAFVNKIVANGDSAVDYTYTTGTTSVSIFCIAVNPTIADSVFATS